MLRWGAGSYLPPCVMVCIGVGSALDEVKTVSLDRVGRWFTLRETGCFLGRGRAGRKRERVLAPAVGIGRRACTVYISGLMDPFPATRQSGEFDRPAAEEVLEEAFLRHQDELFGTLRYLVGNADDARDALQEAFLKCWRHRQEVPGVQNLKAWMFRIALNTGRDVRSTAWRRRRQSLHDGEALLPAAEEADGVERSEEVARVRTALGELRREEQEVFLLRQNGDLTYEQIAEATGLPVGTVKTRMRLALEKLRKALETP